jgi:asparagine synthase (glutamine-hydrolysing)
VRPIESAAEAIRSRGPDGWRTWRSPDGQAELLHARLAITDPDPAAAQPFVGRHGQGILVFNGEIYNYRSLRNLFGKTSWATDSDTEVLSEGLEAEGLRFLAKASGTFSGAWIDRQSRRIFLFRDPVGKKPLLVWPDPDGSLLFGSSVRALSAIRSVPGEIRQAALQEIFADGHCDPAGGIFQGLRHVAPGTLLEYDFDGRLVREGRIGTKPQLEYEGESFDEASIRLGGLLDQAVARRLENNPEPASLLSGGIDSTVVTAIATRILRQRGQNLVAYSLRPFIGRTQDSRHAGYAAKRIGLDIQWVSLPRGELPARIIAALNRLDEPITMISYFLLHELVRAIRPQSRILLNGEGGDEVFCGYGSPADWSGERAERAAGHLEIGGAVPQWFSPWAERCVTRDLFGHGFQKVDRSSAEQGVEVRSPLLDFDVIGYARSLPPEILFHGGRPKALLKAALAGWPASFIDRPKVGTAYNLRWQWLASNFAGLRENVDPALVDALEEAVPTGLKGHPRRWSARQIFAHFPQAYSLLVMSIVMANLARPGHA